MIPVRVFNETDRKEIFSESKRPASLQAIPRVGEFLSYAGKPWEVTAVWHVSDSDTILWVVSRGMAMLGSGLGEMSFR